MPGSLSLPLRSKTVRKIGEQHSLISIFASLKAFFAYVKQEMVALKSFFLTLILQTPVGGF